MDHEVIIIGGSFAGLAAAMQIARARRRVAIIDAGSPRNRFAYTSHGFLGQDGKSPREIVAAGRSQLLAYPNASLIEAKALYADKREYGFHVELEGGQSLDALRLIIATGVVDELPPISGLSERWGVTVLHCPYCHGYEVADRQIGVLGLSAMSIHQAALVSDWGPVTLFTQDVVRPDPEQSALLARRGVKIERASVVELVGSAPELTAVCLDDGRTVPIGAMFIAPRTRFESALATRLGCAIEDGPMGPYLKVDERKETTIRGVYAAGDVAAAMPNATLSAAAGVIAGGSAHQSLIFG